MPRTSDVDKVAPDDPVVANQPLTPPKDKPTAKTEPRTNKFRDNIYQILGHTSNPFSSMLVNPKVFSFEEKDTDEEIILVLRPHWFTNVHWIVVTTIFLVLPFFLNLPSLFSSIKPSFAFTGILFWYLVTFIYAFEKFLSWYFNVFIITDERVIDIDFNNLLVKKFGEAKINMIQDVSSKVIGFFPTIFNYGTVLIQTASEVNQIIFENVSSPEKVIKVLQQLRQEEELETLEGRIK